MSFRCDGCGQVVSGKAMAPNGKCKSCYGEKQMKLCEEEDVNDDS